MLWPDKTSAGTAIRSKAIVTAAKLLCGLVAGIAWRNSRLDFCAAGKDWMPDKGASRLTQKLVVGATSRRFRIVPIRDQKRL